MLKIYKMLLIAVFLCTAVLSYSMVQAKGKGPAVNPTQAKGGLPRCQKNLINALDLVSSCNSDLGESQAYLTACQSNLTVCEDRLVQIDTDILVIDDSFSRIDAFAVSGDGVSTVFNECGDGIDTFIDATASLEVRQSGDSARVKIVMQNGKPNTLYDVWLRLTGSDQDGNSFGRSPITGGGATPLAASTNLDQLVADWVGPGSSSSANSFRTDSQGDVIVEIDLDFPLVGGAYPFNNMSALTLALAQTKRPSALATPTAVVDPRQNGISGPFFLRIVSHCQDDLIHGLSPANREAWFQYP